LAEDENVVNPKGPISAKTKLVPIRTPEEQKDEEEEDKEDKLLSISGCCWYSAGS
jgi:TATA-binding protein-associated factor Taf7